MRDLCIEKKYFGADLWKSLVMMKVRSLIFNY